MDQLRYLIKGHKKSILFILLLSILYIAILAFWAKGKLLFGGDDTGFYNVSDFLNSPSISGFFWAITYILCFNNIYLGYYLHYFIDTFLSTFSIYILSYIIFEKLNHEDRVLISCAAAVLFLFNPWSVSLTYLSIVGDVGLGVAGFTTFLIGYFYFMKHFLNRRMVLVASIIAGTGLGISLSPFPNYLRLLAIVLILYFCFTIYLIYETFRRREYKKVAYVNFAIFFSISIFIAATLSINYLLPVLTNLHAALATAASGASNKVYLGFYTGQFNDMANVLRGLAGWQYPYIFYYSWYENLNVLMLISFLWPLFALLLPSFFALKNRIKIIYPMIVGLLLVIFLEKGENPPLGFLWIKLMDVLPYKYQFIPTGYLTSLFITRFYPLLAAFSIIMVYSLIQERFKSAKTRSGRAYYFIKNHNKSLVLVPLILIILLSASAFPFFSGPAVTYTYNGSNENNAGFYVPPSYFYAKDFLEGNSKGIVLLMPPTTSNPYISTTWGYVGEVGFYQAFFAPLDILTLNNFGGTYNSPSEYSTYFNLTHPLFYDNSSKSFELNNTYVDLLQKYDIKYIMFDSSISSGLSSTSNYTKDVIDTMDNVPWAKKIFQYAPLTIFSVTGTSLSNQADPDSSATPYSNEYNNPDVGIIALNENATRFQNSYYADAGNIVKFSVPENLSLSNITWFVNGTFYSTGDSIKLSFDNPAIYRISVSASNGYYSSINYTVNPKMKVFFSSPTVIYTGVAFYLNGGVSGGTVFPDAGYHWSWYINGVYQYNISDASYMVPFIFNKPGSYNITLIVNDALLENASHSVLIRVVNAPPAWEQQLIDNLSPAIIFYLIIVISVVISMILYKRKENKRRVI
ncbi:MAG: hypothetical protein QW292_13095 [Candidatus Parvarchaeota archaeon]